MTVRNTFFWAVITKRVVEIYGHIGGKYYLYLPQKIRLLLYTGDGRTGFCETSVPFQLSMRRYVPEVSILQWVVCLLISEDTKFTKKVS